MSTRLLLITYGGNSIFKQRCYIGSASLPPPPTITCTIVIFPAFRDGSVGDGIRTPISRSALFQVREDWQKSRR